MPSHSGSERILLTRPGGSQVREFLKAHQLEKFFDDITGHGVTEEGEHQLKIGSMEKLSKVGEGYLEDIGIKRVQRKKLIEKLEVHVRKLVK